MQNLIFIFTIIFMLIGCASNKRGENELLGRDSAYICGQLDGAISAAERGLKESSERCDLISRESQSIGNVLRQYIAEVHELQRELADCRARLEAIKSDIVQSNSISNFEQDNNSNSETVWY